jgi:thiamine-monophosphate kinase
MKVSELGEFGLIELLTEMTGQFQATNSSAGQNLILGIGDDAAAWQSDGLTQLITADSLIDDVHFSLAITPWHELGWKALAVNLSDIAAMGGTAQYAVVSLAVPASTEVENISALYRGMIELAEESGVVIIGGDTSSAPLVMISVTVLGTAGKHPLRSQNNQGEKLLTRSGARPGDRIAVTGYLGAASAGMAMLTGKLKFDTAATSQLREAFLRPRPRLTEGQILREQGIECAIDISDGLVSDLNHICRASRLGARIEVDQLPIHPDVKANLGARALELALSGGEDYELLFTGSNESISRIKQTIPCPITIIGEMLADANRRITLVDHRGNPVKPVKRGWEHFTRA